jgi:hypothetical protein
MSWQDAQKWETDWHGNCVNTYGEEEKQLVYARRMGLKFSHDGKTPYNIKLERTVIDIGGGPASLLLKCVRPSGHAGVTVLDPMPLPEWVMARYRAAGVQVIRGKGEDVRVYATHYDEAWIYNCLQHTEDPAGVVARARECADLIRIFEWLDTPVNVGHLHTLTEQGLNEWLGGEGQTERLNGQANCYGRCYYGIFPTDGTS